MNLKLDPKLSAVYLLSLFLSRGPSQVPALVPHARALRIRE